LPDELILFILSFLGVKDLIQFSEVSRFWRRLTEDDQIWRSLFIRRWGNEAHQNMVRKMSFESGATSDTGEDDAETTRNPDFEPRRVKRKKRSWADIYVDGDRIEKNWKAGKCSITLLTQGNQLPKNVYCLKFDHRFLLTGGHSTNDNDNPALSLRLMELDSGRVNDFLGHDEVCTVDFDDTRIASGSRNSSIVIWDINTSRHLHTVSAHAGAIKCLQMADGLIVSGSEDATIQVLDLRSNQIVNSFIGHRWGVACLQFKDNYLVSGSRDRKIRLWDMRYNRRSSLKRMNGHTNTVRCVAFNSNNIVSGSWDNTIKVWSTKTGELVNTLRGHQGRVMHLDFDDKKIVSGSADQTLRVWSDYKAANPKGYSLSPHRSPIFYVKVDAEGISSASRDTKIIRCDFLPKNRRNTRQTVTESA